MNLLKFGPFELRPGSRQLWRDGVDLSLTPKTYETLLFLVRHSHRVVTKAELMDAVWPDAVVDENNLNQQISALRKVLGERADEGRYIRTVSGHGYRFVAEVEETTDEAPAERGTPSGGALPASGSDPNHGRATTLPSPGETGSKFSGWRRRGAVPITAALLLVLAIGGGIAWWRARTGSEQAQKRPPGSLAVLPFRSLSGSDDYLGLGLTDVLITRLSNVHGVVVRPTAAIRRYAMADTDPLAAGRALRVDSVLDGTIQRESGRIRVSVRLLRVTDGSALWGDTFDDRLTDLFAVEDSLSGRLTRALALRLTDDEQRRMMRRGTENREAHEWYLRGRYDSAQWTEEGFRRAREAFQHAIALDPRYALAHAGLADAYYRVTTLYLDPKVGVPAVRTAVQTALRLDDSLSEAHATLGVIKYRYDWDFGAAEREFRAAIAQNPENGEAHQWYSEYLTAMGRVDESVAEAKRGVQINPLSSEAAWDLGLALLFGRRAGEAVEQLRAAVELDPKFWPTRSFLGWAYGEAGDYDRAYQEFATARALDDNPDLLGAWIYIAHRAGRDADAQRMLNELLERARKGYVAPFYIAHAYIACGDRERGFAWLQKAIAERNELLVFLKVAPSFSSVRDDPRFSEAVRRIGL